MRRKLDMITFKEYLAEIALKGKLVKAKKKVTEKELRQLVKNRDVEGLENADVSEITDMTGLFRWTNIGSPEFNPYISDWDTSNVTSMEMMFWFCENLKEAPEFDTSNVTNMLGMFFNCLSLEEAPKYDTSSVTNIAYMFINCATLKEAPEFDTSNVTDMKDMFGKCKSLEEAPNFDTSNVTNMDNMFRACTSLTKGDMSNWNVLKVKNKIDMFRDCPFPEDKKPKFKV